MIKSLFFDAAGTLFHLPRGIGWHYRDVAGRFGCVLEEDTLNRAFRTAWREMPPRPASRQPRPDDDRDWWFALVERVLDFHQIPPPTLDRAAYFEAVYAEFTQPGLWELFPEVHEVLTALRPHYRLGIISNFDGRLRPILAHLGLADWFDPIVLSSEAGADKPDPWIFQKALAISGVAAHEALHIGDEPTADWQGAAQAGLHAFHLDRHTTTLRDLQSFLSQLSALNPQLPA